jgi:hypothetical protein
MQCAHAVAAGGGFLPSPGYRGVWAVCLFSFARSCGLENTCSLLDKHAISFKRVCCVINQSKILLCKKEHTACCLCKKELLEKEKKLKKELSYCVVMLALKFYMGYFSFQESLILQSGHILLM